MAAGSGCIRPDPAVDSSPLNVIVALADTLRADHMSCYGYHRQTTPLIDSLAENSVLFERARSQAACTFPSVNSILTSRYAAVFLRQGKGKMGIPEQYATLPEILKTHGYSTIAVSASPIFRATPSKVNLTGGFGRGFDIFDEEPLWREAAYVNRQALEHLDDVEGPFFLYLHYMDPHDPYGPPEKFKKQFVRPYDGHDFIAEGGPNPIADMLYNNGPKVEINARDIEHLVDLYDDEIRYFDREFGKLIAALEKRDLLDRTLLVLASDHGEEFMEHGHVKHCRVLFDSSTRTPLIVRIPRVTAGARVTAAVQNIDIVPTILDYLHLSIDEHDLSGSSLRPLIEKTEDGRGYAFSDQGRWRSADDGRSKLILDGLSLEYDLYDLINDPQELVASSDRDSPRARELDRQIEEWLRLTLGGSDLEESLAMAKKKHDELRALGYLQ